MIVLYCIVSQFCPSVCPSICPLHGWISQKRSS